jgi:hypothetical protein
VGSSERETRCGCKGVRCSQRARTRWRERRCTAHEAHHGGCRHRSTACAQYGTCFSNEQRPVHPTLSCASLFYLSHHHSLAPPTLCLLVIHTRAQNGGRAHTHTSSKRMKEKMCGTQARCQRQHIVQMCGIRLAADHVVTPLPRVAVVESDACACPATPSHTHFHPHTRLAHHTRAHALPRAAGWRGARQAPTWLTTR